MNKYPVPAFCSVKVSERREYEKYFDEPVDVYNKRHNGIFNFELKFDFNTNTGKLVIPDCGGHVDSCPLSQKQLEWTLSELQNLSVKRTWATMWDFLNGESYVSFVDSLTAGSSIIKFLSFSCDINNLSSVLSHIYSNNLNAKSISFRDGKEWNKVLINESINNTINNISGSNYKSENEFIMNISMVLNNESFLTADNISIDVSIDEDIL